MADPRAWGVDTGYWDALGTWHVPPDATIAAILAEMGAPDAERPPPPPATTVRLDRPLPPVAPGALVLEDGTEVPVEGSLPPDLPPGYHQLRPREGEPRPLIASPGRCPLPAGPGWGFAAQLYAARSRASWGMGDLGDLRRLGGWAASLGASVILVNPLHAAAPVAHQEPSPYLPTSRCFANPLYLRVEDLPGAGDLPGIEGLAAAGHALNTHRRIERDAIWALKSAAFEALFARFPGDPAFDAFRAERGTALEGFATYCALAERHGGSWPAWPAGLRHPGAPAVRRFARGEGAARVRYHAWLQWHLDRQLAAASRPGLVADLAVGVDGGGADAWLWQEVLARGMRVGAPPDELNTLGQDWGMPPWDPWRLQTAGFGPFVETLRAGLRHARGLRVDHVMGLFRLYWIPAGAPATAGTYVRYPSRALLDIVALEAHRAGAFVVGEDLGTVEAGVREELAERGVLSYRLLWFEPGDPAGWPVQSLGAVTTHDLPTVAGIWAGSDLAAQRRLGLAPNEAAAAALRERLGAWSGGGAGLPVEAVVEHAHARLARAPSLLLTATLDDLAAVEERPNMPGTVDEWPNWRIALPQPLEVLERSPLAARLAAVLARHGGRTGPAGT